MEAFTDVQNELKNPCQGAGGWGRITANLLGTVRGGFWRGDNGEDRCCRQRENPRLTVTLWKTTDHR